MQEQEIIRRYFGFAGGSGVRLGVGDDAAVLAPPPGELVISTDTLNAGAHFFADVPAELLAAKAAAVSLSDIAAMGGKPLWLTVALTAPAATNGAWFEAFALGLSRSSRAYDYAVVGGDLTCGELLSVTTTAVGVCALPPRTRALAQAGDDVWLSGAVGGAAHALFARLGRLPAAADMRDCEARLHNPAPRVRLAQKLAGEARAMMDISDGLLQCAQTISEQSAVHICLDAAAVPLPPSLAAVPAAAARQCQFTGGDDYELLFTAPRAAAARIAALASAETPLSRIGVVRAGSGVQVQLNGETLAFNTAGYSHQFS